MMKEKEFIKRRQGTSQRGCAMKTAALALCAEALGRLVLTIVSSFDLHNSIYISVNSVFSVLKKSTAQYGFLLSYHRIWKKSVKLKN